MEWRLPRNTFNCLRLNKVWQIRLALMKQAMEQKNLVNEAKHIGRDAENHDFEVEKIWV